MRLILFRKGRPGTMATMPGERPKVELSDLLGGETAMQPITSRLTLVTLADAVKLGLPPRYAMKRPGKADMPVFGDCAVVAVKESGILTDVIQKDLKDAAKRVLLLQGVGVVEVGI